MSETNTKQVRHRAGLQVIPKNIPEDVHGIIIRKQGQKSAHCLCVISKEAAIYSIIREWEGYDKENKEKAA